MKMNMKRRVFLKGTLAGVGVAAGAGLLAPQAVLASWNKAAFDAKDANSAIEAAMGGKPADSADITVEAPDIAENGAVVPVAINATKMADVESITIVAENNSTPLAAIFTLSSGVKSFVSCRIKMGKTGKVIAVVKAGGKLYSASKEVKVTIGGCGG